MCCIWVPYTWGVSGATDPIYNFVYRLGFIFEVSGNINKGLNIIN